MVGSCSVFGGQNFECCNYLHEPGPAQSDGRYFSLFRTGADVSPLQGQALSWMLTELKGIKDLPAGLQCRGLITGFRLFSGFTDICL